MGVDSGLPDFRGNACFWRAYPALAEAPGLHRGRLSVHVRARPGAGLGLLRAPVGFLPTDPPVPHDGFASLRKWAARTHLGAFVFTSNVDGQFQKAGFDANAVHECTALTALDAVETVTVVAYSTD